ncbi:MAG: hypothetical protein M1823_006674, partial [Watsoniomyces obsoletus]
MSMTLSLFAATKSMVGPTALSKICAPRPVANGARYLRGLTYNIVANQVQTLFQDRIQAAQTACPDLGIHL